MAKSSTRRVTIYINGRYCPQKCVKFDRANIIHFVFPPSSFHFDTHRKSQKKSPLDIEGAKVLGDDLLFHLLQAVPSARSVLTSLFGMGRGVPRRYCHRNVWASGLPTYAFDKSVEEENFFLCDLHRPS